MLIKADRLTSSGISFLSLYETKIENETKKIEAVESLVFRPRSAWNSAHVFVAMYLLR